MKVLLRLDFDGDKMLATADPRIVNNIKDYDYIIFDKGISSDKVENNWRNRIDFFVKTSTPDKTGYITNLATKWTDLAHNYRLIGDDVHQRMYETCTIALRFLQGWEIDSAKTGKNAEAIGFPKQLKAAKTPHHFIGMRKIQDRAVNIKQEDVYVSRAALGFLFDYVKDYRANHLVEGGKSNPKLHYLGKLLNAEEMEASGIVLPYIKNLERDYRREIAVIASLKDEIDKKTFMDFLTEVYEKYNRLLMSLINEESGITEKVVIYTAYFVTYVRSNHESNSTSFPWNCMFDSMIMLLTENDTAVRMYRIPFDEIEEMRIENSHLIVNQKDLGSVPCDIDMDLAVTVIDNRPFAIVPVTVKKEPKPKKLPVQKTYQVSVTGFRHNVSGNCENFIEMVKANNCMMDFVYENNGVIVKINGQQVAALCSDFVVNDIINTTVILKSYGATTYVPKQSRKSTVMKNETEAYSGTITLEVIPYQEVGEQFNGFGQAIETKPVSYAPATEAEAYGNDYSEEMYVADDYYCNSEDFVVSAAEYTSQDSFYEDMAKDTIGCDIDFDFEDLV